MTVKKSMFLYILSSVALFIGQWVYHLFSHGVVSIGLKYVWILPLVFGLILLLLNIPLNTLKNKAGCILYNIGLTFLVNTIVLKGILDIAGSDSPYIDYFYLASVCIICLSLLVFIGSIFRKQTA